MTNVQLLPWAWAASGIAALVALIFLVPLSPAGFLAGAINGTSYAPDGGGIEGAVVADAFWQLYQARGEMRARVS